MKKFITIFIIIIILGVITVPRVIEKLEKSNSSDDGLTVVTVEGVAAKSGDVSTSLDLIGNATAETTAPVLAPIPAKVLEVKVTAGTFVNEGDVLFSLDPSDVESQVTQANLSVKQAQAGLNQAAVGIDNARMAIDNANLAYDMAVSNYEMNKDQYEYAASNLEKYATMYEEGIVSEAEYEQVKLQASPETLTLLDKQLAQAEQGKEQAQLGLRQAQAAYSQANAGVSLAKEGYKTAVDTKEDLVVTAPVSGFVTSVSVSKDGMASNTSPAMMIEAMDVIKVATTVTANSLAYVEAGETVQVSIEALNQTFSGTVESVATSANMQTMLYPVVVVVDNEDHAIKPGMFATVKVTTESAKNAIVVPTEAVIMRDDASYVYVQTSETTAEQRMVEVGIDTGYEVEILDGISEGDVVITGGVGLINDKTQLNVVRGDE